MDGNNTLQIKAIKVVISTFETRPKHVTGSPCTSPQLDHTINGGQVGPERGPPGLQADQLGDIPYPVAHKIEHLQDFLWCGPSFVYGSGT